MGSVRERLERQARAGEDLNDKPPVTNRPMTMNNHVAGNAPTRTVRARQIAEQEAKTEERLVPLPKATATGMTANVSFNQRVRDRQAAAEWNRSQVAPAAPTKSSYQLEYEREQAEKKAQELADIKSGRLKIL